MYVRVCADNKIIKLSPLIYLFTLSIRKSYLYKSKDFHLTMLSIFYSFFQRTKLNNRIIMCGNKIYKKRIIKREFLFSLMGGGEFLSD